MRDIVKCRVEDRTSELLLCSVRYALIIQPGARIVIVLLPSLRDTARHRAMPWWCLTGVLVLLVRPVNRSVG